MKRLSPFAALAALTVLAACGRGTDLAAPGPRSVAPSAALLALTDGDTVMRGLANPRGLAFGPDSALYVAEAGRGGPRVPGPCFVVPPQQTFCYGATGAVSRLLDGVQERLVDDLPSYAQVNSGLAEGPNGVSLHGRGGAYVSIGLEGNPLALRAQAPEWSRFAQLVHLSPTALANGKGKGPAKDAWEFVADLGQYEIDVNPDCGDIDSNPFGVLAEPGGVIVADAGANAIVRRAANGDLSNFAVFSNNTTNPALHEGCPAAATRDFVPTSITVGPDGAYYIGHLNGLPILAGSSSVWRMEEGGTPAVHFAGFTWIISLAFDPAGNLYVLQYSNGPLTNSGGSLLRVAPDGSRLTILNGIPRPGGVAVDDAGQVYVSMVPGPNFKGEGLVMRYTVAP